MLNIAGMRLRRSIQNRYLRKSFTTFSNSFPMISNFLRLTLFNALFKRRRSVRETILGVEKIKKSELQTIYIEISGLADVTYLDGVRTVAKYFIAALSKTHSDTTRIIFVEYIRRDFFESNYIWDESTGNFIKNRSRKSRNLWNPSQGDVILFFTFDFFDSIPFRKLRKISQQIDICTFVFDLLPLQQKSWFTRQALLRFNKSLTKIIEFSMLILTNSEETKNQFDYYFSSDEEKGAIEKLVKVISLESIFTFKKYQVVFDKTSDIEYENQNLALSKKVRSRVVLISTVEPRKGYDDLIESAESAWDYGAVFDLVIIGRLGWVNKEFQEKFERFVSTNSQRVLWFRNASDVEVSAILDKSDLLISTSRGEGFGLPIGEALAHSVPVLIRNIDVYREIYANYAIFFGENSEFDNLEEALKRIDKCISLARVKSSAFILPDINASCNSLIRILKSF